jgi:hypothetical protein
MGVGVMTKEQAECFLHIMGTLVDQQERQAVALEALITVLGSIDGQLMDLTYHIRYGGGS